MSLQDTQSLGQPRPMDQLSPQAVRQRLAGLIDPAEKVSVTDRELWRLLAIEFASCLPIVFGDTLDRTTLWDRIASGLQSAYAKTAGSDIELFVQHIMEHIKAEASRVVASDRVCGIQERLYDLDDEGRRGFMDYVATHLIPVLTFARREWKSSIGGAK